MAKRRARERRRPRRRPPRQGRGNPPDHRPAVGNRRALRGRRGGSGHPVPHPFRGAGTTSSCGTTRAAGRSCFRASTRHASTAASGSRSTGRSPHCRGSTRFWTGDGSEVRVRFWTHSRQTPFRVERVLRLHEGEPELLVEGSVRNDVDGGGAFRLGPSLCRRAAVSRARAAGSRSRHGRSSPHPSSGSPRRRGSSRAVVSRGRGRRDEEEERSIFARFRGRRRGATTISTSPISTRGGSRCQTLGSTSRSGSSGSRRCSAGSCCGSPTAARSRRRSRARMPSASSRGRAGSASSRPSRQEWRPSSREARTFTTSLRARLLHGE